MFIGLGKLERDSTSFGRIYVGPLPWRKLCWTYTYVYIYARFIGHVHLISSLRLPADAREAGAAERQSGARLANTLCRTGTRMDNARSD